VSNNKLRLLVDSLVLLNHQWVEELVEAEVEV
jgi:hypothetical protein